MAPARLTAVRTTQPRFETRARQASFVIAMIIPITTNITIATCIQIHVGDICTTA
jgi:hypothetical protein